MVFGIYSDGKTSIPSSLQRAQVSNIRILSFFSMVFNFCNVTSQQIKGGKGLATLKKENILQTFSTIEELVGNSIYVAVIVQTENGMLFFLGRGGTSSTAMFAYKKNNQMYTDHPKMEFSIGCLSCIRW